MQVVSEFLIYFILFYGIVAEISTQQHTDVAQTCKMLYVAVYCIIFIWMEIMYSITFID